MSTGTQVQVVMPQMGVSVSEGTVTKWLKQEGEQIEQDEPLLEISTDKVDTEVPSPGAGTVVQILVPEGETVDVGTVLALIGAAGSQVVEPQEPPARNRQPGAPAEQAPAGTAPHLSHRPCRSPRRSALHLLPPRRSLPPRATGRASSRRSSHGSPPSTGSTRPPSLEPGPGAASRRRTSSLSSSRERRRHPRRAPSRLPSPKLAPEPAPAPHRRSHPSRLPCQRLRLLRPSGCAGSRTALRPAFSLLPRPRRRGSCRRLRASSSSR